MAKKIPNPIDVHVGSRVRIRRVELGMSQGKLGDALGITFQQVQKYEKGTNRIGASRLQHVSSILQVAVAYFCCHDRWSHPRESIYANQECQIAAPHREAC